MGMSMLASIDCRADITHWEPVFAHPEERTSVLLLDYLCHIQF